MSNPGDPLIWPGSLRVAYTTVNDSRQYFCAYCSKTLSTVTRLRRHERQVHSINALEWCQLCPRRFSDKREFNVHDHSWPQGIYVLDVTSNTFECTNCDGDPCQLIDLPAITHHVKEHHPNITWVKGVNPPQHLNSGPSASSLEDMTNQPASPPSMIQPPQSNYQMDNQQSSLLSPPASAIPTPSSMPQPIQKNYQTEYQQPSPLHPNPAVQPPLPMYSSTPGTHLEEPEKPTR